MQVFYVFSRVRNHFRNGQNCVLWYPEGRGSRSRSEKPFWWEKSIFLKIGRNVLLDAENVSKHVAALKLIIFGPGHKEKTVLAGKLDFSQNRY